MIEIPDANNLRNLGFPDQFAEAIATTPATVGLSSAAFADLREWYAPYTAMSGSLEKRDLVNIWRLLDTIEVLIGLRNPDGTWIPRRFVARVTAERHEGGMVGAADGYATFNDAASRDAFVAEFPEGRRAAD